jgi:quercetin dioxygenase-like cupin family protein
MRKVVLAGAVAGTLLLSAAPADATPSSGVTGTVLARTTVDGRDYVLRQVTIAVGGTTGWHYHDGTLYAVVRQGTLTRTMADCATTEVSPPGSAVIEEPGANHVHVGRNLGPTPVVLDVLYVLPAGSPLSEDAANPGCAFGERR